MAINENSLKDNKTIYLKNVDILKFFAEHIDNWDNNYINIYGYTLQVKGAIGLDNKTNFSFDINSLYSNLKLGDEDNERFIDKKITFETIDNLEPEQLIYIKNFQKAFQTTFNNFKQQYLINLFNNDIDIQSSMSSKKEISFLSFKDLYKLDWRMKDFDKKEKKDINKTTLQKI